MQTLAPQKPRTESKLAVWMAWRRYLVTVRASSPETYEIVEETAWERLADELADAGASVLGLHATETG